MMEVKRFGEKSLIIQFENIISIPVHQQVKNYYKYLLQSSMEGIKSISPAYNSITLIYDPFVTSFDKLKLEIENIEIDGDKELEQKVIEIPVCYATSLGLDIEEVAQSKNISIDEIIHLHTAPHYTVYMLGFSPGFMYLGGLDPQLFTPRKKTPRLQIPAGAVGLADQQTGIYPSATPGGWQIIGQTPVPIFQVNEKPLVRMGDQIKFKSIDLDTFHQLKNTK
ncbi:5-oxoprolinase subunit PxpB [Flammeovirga sp. EKP202]|uniref:5-oxoprolinase subunit PxpB n=1 Tax=Flammeovirga sp. EKP202 TaxID=2770592 RepID=UPI00165FB23B|nr:5-oxoprolinase subunit PxpB [Flammeovirga sp. EKP202]MBD0399869.1 5-oxoprolinase subunit PxpB [Flammeovirga sp. EKP202]